MTPGEVLREARLRADMTQEQLAREMARRMRPRGNPENIRQQLSKIESGRRGVGDTWAQLLSRIPELGLNAEELLVERANLTTILTRLSIQAALLQDVTEGVAELLAGQRELRASLDDIGRGVAGDGAPPSPPRTRRT